MAGIRKAKKEDVLAIHWLIYRAMLNPFDLNWRHFLVAVGENDGIVGIGQIKTHGDGAREMASIAVRPDQRGRGIGSAIIRQLLAENEPPLYLTCRASMEPFYEKFGFRTVSAAEMSPYFRRLYRLSVFAKKLVPKIGNMCVMVKTA